MDDSLRRITKDGADLAGVVVPIDKSSAIDLISSGPADGETRVGLLNVDEQDLSIAGDRCGQLIGRVQQQSIAGLGGKQQQLAKGDDSSVEKSGSENFFIDKGEWYVDKLSGKLIETETPRGNNRAATFFADDDYRFFLECLRQAKMKCQCRVYAYALMTNHVHLLVEPAEIGDMGRLMQSVGRRYVRYVNENYGRTGTLWESRFRSAAVSRDEYLIACSRYIELHPVRAGIVAHPKDYQWSSYRHRALGVPDRLLDEDPWYIGLGSGADERQENYRKWMDSRFDEREWDEIRKATQRGRLIGKETFQKQVEEMTGRRLVGEGRGRPKKKPGIPVEKVL